MHYKINLRIFKFYEYGDILTSIYMFYEYGDILTSIYMNRMLWIY